MGVHAKDLIGRKYNRLLVLKRVENRGDRPCWECVCDCGKNCVVKSKSLVSGDTKSCGCLRKEVTAGNGKKHGLSRTRTYCTWHKMIDRCLNSSSRSYKHYGGRGIKVCDHWLSLENFYADMGERPEKTSIDRIDVNGDYCPENCRWANPREQGRNRRNNILVEFKGQTLCMKDLCASFGFSYDTIKYRINKGMSLEQALTTPGYKNLNPNQPQEFT